MKKLALGTVLLLFSAATAGAQSIKTTVWNFGLFGTWAVNCVADPAPGNSHTIYSVTSLRAVRVQNDFGNNYDDMIYDIVDARRVGGDRLALRQILISDPKILLDVVIVKSGDRTRIWFSREVGGALLVIGGTFPDGPGAPTRWAERCNERRVDGPELTPRFAEPEMIPSASGIVFKPDHKR